MINTLINRPDNVKQLSVSRGNTAFKVIYFRVGTLNLGLRIESVYKVLNQTQVHGSGINSVGIAHMGDRELIVVDLQQQLFQSSIINSSQKRGYLVVAQDAAGEFYGIPVATAPALMEVPLASLRVLPESYRHADTLGIASHVAVIPQPETPLTLFLLDVDRLLTTA